LVLVLERVQSGIGLFLSAKTLDQPGPHCWWLVPPPVPLITQELPEHSARPHRLQVLSQFTLSGGKTGSDDQRRIGHIKFTVVVKKGNSANDTMFQYSGAWRRDELECHLNGVSQTLSK
jgi:hypothetical protein